MALCSYGSQSKPDSPSSFTVGTGAICFLLGIDNVLCPILDRIPQLIGLSWKEIIVAVARDVLEIAIDEVTGQIPTSVFCSVDPPPLPADFTFAEVFEFIASYVPPFSSVAESSPLLSKITRFYLYQKWFELCECKPRNFPPPSARQPNPDFGNGACEASSQYAVEMQEDINYANELNSFVSPSFPKWYAINSSDVATQVTEAQYNTALVKLQDGDDEVESLAFYSFSTPCPLPVSSRLGCLYVEKMLFNDRAVEQHSASLRRRSDGFTYTNSVKKEVYCWRTITWDESECCPPPPPPPPPTLPPPPQNCEPVPPPEYCKYFPEDPRCSNVPPPEECPPSGGCEIIDILVDDYTCGLGFSQKTVNWATGE